MRALKVILAVVVAAAGLAAASPTPLAQPGMCFRSSDWNGWKATPDGSNLYIATGLNTVFRLELAQPCPELHDNDAKLLTRTHTSWICSPTDLDLRVFRPFSGLATSCRVKRMTRLYPSEVRALPKAVRP